MLPAPQVTSGSSRKYWRFDAEPAKADNPADCEVESSGSGFAITEASDFFVTSSFSDDAPWKSGFAAIPNAEADSEELACYSIADLAALCLAVFRCASANGIAQTPRSRSR